MPQDKGHVPERTCIACGKKSAKWQLVRIVRTPDGSIEVDLKGKKSGRGAYLCHSRTCWERALRRDRKNRLAWALKTEISPEVRTRLWTYSEEFPPNSSEVVADQEKETK